MSYNFGLYLLSSDKCSEHPFLACFLLCSANLWYLLTTSKQYSLLIMFYFSIDPVHVWLGWLTLHWYSWTFSGTRVTSSHFMFPLFILKDIFILDVWLWIRISNTYDHILGGFMYFFWILIIHKLWPNFLLEVMYLYFNLFFIFGFWIIR